MAVGVACNAKRKSFFLQNAVVELLVDGRQDVEGWEAAMWRKAVSYINQAEDLCLQLNLQI